MTGPQRILVLDDDPAIGTLVKRTLSLGGFEVEAVTGAQALLRSIRRLAVDLVILDLNLGVEDGLDVLRQLRSDNDVPVIILTARGEPIDRVIGLELGADDYVAKPFEPRELLARVRTILRRAVRRGTGPEAGGGEVLRFAGLRLDLSARTLTRDGGEAVALTAAQFDILTVLATHPNRVLSRDQILGLARDRGTNPFDRSIDVHISQLRRRIETDSRNPELIKTIYGMGYIFAQSPRTG